MASSTSALPVSTRSLDRPEYRTIGVRVHAVQIPDVIETIREWISQRERNHYIAVTGMHGVSEAQQDPSFRRVLNEADLVVPDGMPLVWLARRRGYPLERRVYGPELMETFCKQVGSQYRHFLYGGAPGIAERLADVMRDRYGCNVVGTITPPFRELSRMESDEIVDQINAAEPDVIWVGLSTPKQEKWMASHKASLRAPVSVGVGAAFDFLAGIKSSAPAWMQENGLEWLYRLGKEPRRLWRRYLIGGSSFAYRVLRDEMRLRGDD